jgi:hypothetical protein
MKPPRVDTSELKTAVGEFRKFLDTIPYHNASDDFFRSMILSLGMYFSFHISLI